MTAPTLTIRWTGIDTAHDRAALAAVLAVDIPVDGVIEIPGLRLEIGTSGSGRARGRLEVMGMPQRATAALPALPHAEAVVDVTSADPAADEITDGKARGWFGDSSGPASSSVQFLALGWATVDLERAAATWPGVRWRAAPRDPSLGARALVGRAGTRADVAGAEAVTLVLLEPDTEGRVAASLARHGEGPAALYLRVPPDAIAAIAARLARLGVRFVTGSGPFGPEWTVAGSHPSTPTVTVVAGAVPDV